MLIIWAASHLGCGAPVLKLFYDCLLILLAPLSWPDYHCHSQSALFYSLRSSAVEATLKRESSAGRCGVVGAHLPTNAGTRLRRLATKGSDGRPFRVFRSVKSGPLQALAGRALGSMSKKQETGGARGRGRDGVFPRIMPLDRLRSLCYISLWGRGGDIYIRI
jgi:hypothetical protein